MSDLGKENIVYTYNGMLLNLKMKEILTHIKTQIEDILSKISDSHKDKYYMIQLI